MWLKSFERVDGKLHGVAVSPAGIVEYQSPEKLGKLKLPPSTKAGVTAVTDFSDWKREPATEYLEMLGMNPGLAGGHDVFKIQRGRLELIVPALLVMKALFNPPTPLFPYLFMPAGLDLVCAPTWSEEGVDIRVLPYNVRNWLSESSNALLRWFYFYPSARNTWQSVYRYASRGVCSLDLPEARAKISVRGQTVDNKVLVSNLELIELDFLDHPNAWSGNQPTSIQFFKGCRDSQSVTRHNHLIPGLNGWELSDEEWEAVAHLFPPHPQAVPRERRRAVLSAILSKLGTGVGWKAADWSAGTTTGSQVYYRRMVKTGVWVQFEKVVLDIRLSHRDAGTVKA
jgi:transposase